MTDYGDLDKEIRLHGMIEALNNAESDPEKIVLCKSTKYGPGCGHNTMEHTGPRSVNQECDCCTWRHNWPELNPDSTVDVLSSREVFDGQHPRVEPRILETKAQTPEELAQELGVTVAEIPAILMQQMQVINQALGDVTKRMQPQQPNRAARRAAARGKAGAPRYKNGRPTY